MSVPVVLTSPLRKESEMNFLVASSFSFTVDFLTKKKKANEGEIPQYYVKDNHEAIIDPETFEMVQTLMATRKKGRNCKSSVSIFSSKIKCGDCGSWYGPKVWHSNDAYRKVIRQCNHKFDGQKCATPTLTEDEIKELFLRAANQVIDQKEQFIAIYEQVLSRSLDTTALEGELSELEAEINIAAELIEECIKENAHVALDQAEYECNRINYTSPPIMYDLHMVSIHLLLAVKMVSSLYCTL